MDFQGHTENQPERHDGCETISVRPHKPYRRAIIAAVAEVFGVARDDMTAKGRRSMAVSLARCAAMMLIKDVWGISKARIGRDLGGLDHSSVHAGLRKAYRLLEADPIFASKVSNARQMAFSRSKPGPWRAKGHGGAGEVPAGPENPPAVKFGALDATAQIPEVPPYRTLKRSGMATPASDGDATPANAAWWIKNDRRFRAAMEAAHPELVRASSHEATL